MWCTPQMWRAYLLTELGFPTVICARLRHGLPRSSEAVCMCMMLSTVNGCVFFTSASNCAAAQLPVTPEFAHRVAAGSSNAALLHLEDQHYTLLVLAMWGPPQSMCSVAGTAGMLPCLMLASNEPAPRESRCGCFPTASFTGGTTVDNGQAVHQYLYKVLDWCFAIQLLDQLDLPALMQFASLSTRVHSLARRCLQVLGNQLATHSRVIHVCKCSEC